MEKNKIVQYIDWSDFLTQMALSDGYHVVDEVAKDGTPRSDDMQKDLKRLYMDQMAEDYLTQCKRLQDLGFVMDVHCLTGGDMTKSIFGRSETIANLFANHGMPNSYKSLTFEYGMDMLINDYDENGNVRPVHLGIWDENPKGDYSHFHEQNPLKHPLMDTYAFSDELQEDLKAAVPEELAPEFIKYKYYQNVSLRKPGVTEEEFNDIVQLIEMNFDKKGLVFYPYYDPSHGIEIDILPEGLDKATGVKEIQRHFYHDENGNVDDSVALEVFCGDFARVELPSVDNSMGQQVLFVATDAASGVKEATEGTTLPKRTEGYKLAAATNALREIADHVELHGTLPDFNKGNYKSRKAA